MDLYEFKASQGGLHSETLVSKKRKEKRVLTQRMTDRTQARPGHPTLVDLQTQKPSRPSLTQHISTIKCVLSTGATPRFQTQGLLHGTQTSARHF